MKALGFDKTATQHQGSGVSSGFTLIEMLVVIAILAGLLLPVLAHTKESTMIAPVSINRLASGADTAGNTSASLEPCRFSDNAASPLQTP